MARLIGHEEPEDLAVVAAREEKYRRNKEEALRRRGVLLKDVVPLDILVALDNAIDHDLPVEQPVSKTRPVAYLKYAKPEQVEAFESRLRYIKWRQEIPTECPNHRMLSCFDSEIVKFVLKWLTGKNWHKYMRELNDVERPDREAEGGDGGAVPAVELPDERAAL